MKIITNPNCTVTIWDNGKIPVAICLTYNWDLASASILIFHEHFKLLLNNSEEEEITDYLKKDRHIMSVTGTTSEETIAKSMEFRYWDTYDRVQFLNHLQNNCSNKNVTTLIRSWEAVANPTNNRERNALIWLLKQTELDWENNNLQEGFIHVLWPPVFKKQQDAGIYEPGTQMQMAIATLPFTNP